MKTTPIIRVLQIFAALLFLGGGSALAAAEPSDAQIEKSLKGHFTNNDYATRHYELTVESVKRGSPRTGNHWTDGTPANKPTQVIPCKVVWLLVTSYTTDGVVRKERYTGEYVFFLDEFGDWTFRLKDQKSEKL